MDEQTIVAREPYESCSVEITENSKGEARVTVKLSKGGPSISHVKVLDAAIDAFFEARRLIEGGNRNALM